MKSVYTLTIDTLKKHVGGFVEADLTAPSDFPSWKPGQFLSMRKTIGGSEAIRSYSIVTLLSEGLRILVKREANGVFSRWLADYAKPGDSVETLAPSGNFVLPDPAGRLDHLVFFAAGSGIAPMRPLVLQAIQEGRARQIHLLYSALSREEAPFVDEMEGQVLSGLDFQAYLSRMPNGLPNRLTNQRLEVYLEEAGLRPDQNSLFYLCGPISYRRMVRFTLRTMDFGADQIREENFDPQLVRPPARPLLEHDATIVVELPDGTETTFACHPCEPILTAGLRHGVEMPYSCRGGVCASCVAQLKGGKTLITLNEILSPIDLANGITLTCTALPASELIRLRLGASL